MLAIAAALAIVSACGSPVITEAVHVDLDFGVGQSSAIASGALAEAAAVWLPYNVWLHRAPAPHERGFAVRVTIADRPPSNAPDPRAIGSIEFRDGVPTPQITLYQQRAWEVICALAGSTAEHWPVSYRDLVLGRVLGRALAHELGHYLLQSRQHSADGLMRPAQSIADLMAVNRARLFLTPEDIRALSAKRDPLTTPNSCR